MKTYLFILFASITLLVGCSHSEIDNVGPVTEEKLLTITGYTEQLPETRVVYSDEGLSSQAGTSYLNAGRININFESGEIIEFTFAQGSVYKKTTGTVKTGSVEATSDGGSKCQFTVSIPTGINTSIPFDLYAVLAGKNNDSNSKGNYIDSADPRYVSQFIDLNGSYPDINGNRTNDWVDSREVADQIIQVASLKGIVYKSTQKENFINLRFRHLGALLAFVIKNDDMYYRARLRFDKLYIEDTSQTQWIYSPTAKYNLITNMWEGNKTYLADFFYIDNSSVYNRYYKFIDYGKIWPTYRWVVPTGTAPISLKLSMVRDNRSTYSTTLTNPLKPEVGYRYRINRKWVFDRNSRSYIFTTSL